MLGRSSCPTKPPPEDTVARQQTPTTGTAKTFLFFGVLAACVSPLVPVLAHPRTRRLVRWMLPS